MMKKIMFSACVLLPALAMATIYKSVDENGVVTYSDDPSSNSQTVELLKSRKLTHPPEEAAPSLNAVSAKNFTAPPVAPEEKSFQYITLLVIAPQPDEYIRSNDGGLFVSVELTPSFRATDKIQVTLDGKILSPLQTTNHFTIKDIERGQHNIALAVLDAKGNVLMQSKTVNFFMYRNIVVKNKP